MPKLYVLATPIGNLEDLSLRALRTLKEVDFIICEDTRVTSKLLSHYEIKKPLMSYFQHSRLSRIAEISERLSLGESAALVTDAGTPGISDPGGVLIKALTSKLPSLGVSPIPGPCAAIAALSISGLPTDKFMFMGFPPHKKGRQTFWKKVVSSEETVVFYESPHRIIKALTELHGMFGERPIVICRELTKMFESVYRGTIEEVLKKVQADPIKGEYVVIVGP